MFDPGLIGLYTWTILAGALAAPSLAILGCQLAARDRAMQTLCITQGALVGVLVGMIFAPLEFHLDHAFFPPLFALLFCAITHLATERMIRQHSASRNTYFAFTFCLLVSLGYTLTALVPQLENHMTQVYFGDLATLSSHDAVIATMVSLGVLVVGSVGTRKFSHDSFEEAVFNEPPQVFWRDPFFWLTLVLVSFSVQHLGFLYTTAMLFIPTSLLSYFVFGGLTFHLIACALLASASSTIGIFISLFLPRLPTVPTIVLVMTASGAILICFYRLVKGVQS